MDKKYEFIQRGKDDYILKYKDKEIEFNSSVDIVKKMQEALKSARLKMIFDLGRNNMTIKDLVKEEKKEGKTYFDNSNKDELEQIYLQDEQSKVFLEVTKKMFGIELEQLLIDMDLTETKEIEEFSTELGKIIVGQFPSRGNTK